MPASRWLPAVCVAVHVHLDVGEQHIKFARVERRSAAARSYVDAVTPPLQFHHRNLLIERVVIDQQDA